VAFFAVVLLYQVYHFYLLTGELKAIHGRYLFPLIPLMMIGIFIPLNAIFKKYASQLFIILALLMAYTEMNVYFAQAITYYMTAGW
jgi:hypothetical protein